MLAKSKGFLTMDPHVISAKAQLALGVGLSATPLWVTWVQNVSMIAAMIAGIAGAILGIHGVYRIFVNRKPRE